MPDDRIVIDALAKRIDDHLDADKRVHGDIDRRLDEGFARIEKQIEQLYGRFWSAAVAVIALLLTVLGAVLMRGLPWTH